MKTPSKYPVLDNRPIDQWKVTELKEELKRRKLTIGGLKQDLIKRLDEALRVEQDATEAENDNGVEEPNAEIATEVATKQDQAVSDVDESGIAIPDNSEQTAGDADGKGMDAEVVSVPVDCKDSAQQQVKDTSLAKEKLESVTDNAAGMDIVTDNAAEMDVVTSTDISYANMEDKVCDGLSSDAAMAGPGLHDDKRERDNEDSRAQQDSEDVKPLHEDVKLDSSDPNNQVSEVNTNLGIPIKSNSISTDSVSISEKHDLEVNIITDNAKLEPDVMPEMVQPSSSNLAPYGGKSHPTDVEEPHENKVSVNSTDNNNTNADMSRKNHSADLGSSEKLNLDRSSGDDSMEEDALESKQIDSNCNSEEVGERPEKSEVVTVKGESPCAAIDTDLLKQDKSIHIENKDVMAASFEKRELLDQSSGDDSMEEDALESKPIDSNCNSEEVGERPEKSEVVTMKGESPSATMDTDLPKEGKGVHIENKDVMAASFEKRKLQDQEAVLNNEPAKRQRRWKSENTKVREPQISKSIPAASSENVTLSLKRSLSGSISVGANDASKEREVPPSNKAPTSSLRIDRFLRPFTLKAVQELLAKTGTVTGFWMDHIKTHCYVTYSSVEEAVETRNAVYNLQWPPNGGRNLIADFVDPQEVKMRVEVPSQPKIAPASTAPEPSTLPQPSPCHQNLRQQMPQPTLPPSPPLSNPGQVKERAHLPPPPVQEKIEAPIVTLDDLFRKTKATPRIYYLPLSEELVSAKLEARRKNSRQ